MFLVHCWEEVCYLYAWFHNQFVSCVSLCMNEINLGEIELRYCQTDRPAVRAEGFYVIFVINRSFENEIILIIEDDPRLQ